MKITVNFKNFKIPFQYNPLFLYDILYKQEQKNKTNGRTFFSARN